MGVSLDSLGERITNIQIAYTIMLNVTSAEPKSLILPDSSTIPSQRASLHQPARGQKDHRRIEDQRRSAQSERVPQWTHTNRICGRPDRVA